MDLFAPPPDHFAPLERWRHRYVMVFSGPIALLLALLIFAELVTHSMWAPGGELATLAALVATFTANRLGRLRLAAWILLGSTTLIAWIMAPYFTPLLFGFAASVLVGVGLLLGQHAVLGFAGANLAYLAAWLALRPGASLLRFGGPEPPLALALLLLAVMTMNGWFVGVISRRTIGELESALTRARIDGLTGLYNRSSLDQRLEETLALARRHGTRFSILFVDIDLFKRVNDTHGHLAGDGVLRALARVLEETARKSDCVGRYGGEEFALILPHTDRKGALILAERLRLNVASLLIFDERHRRIAITVSIGVTEFRDSDDNVPDLISRADRALFQAKEAGRDRTIVYEEAA